MECFGGNYVAIFDLRSQTKLAAGLDICRTFFVCCVLAAGAIFFQKDAQDLVIKPMDSMIQKVNRIASNPLEAAQEEEQQALAREKSACRTKGGDEGVVRATLKKLCSGQGNPQEIVILEQTIVKVGALLALGFGEAGVKIIADNMANSGDVDPMVPGNKVVAIFGFCDIRQFTDTTEILQEEVMVFVNQIADIVHRIVDRFSGAANKNIGDAFLLVWKLPPNATVYDALTNTMTPNKED